MFKKCSVCGKPFNAGSNRAKYCSDFCRSNASVAAPVRTVRTSDSGAGVAVGSVVEATRTELRELEGKGSAVEVALALARSIDDPLTPASALPGLARQLGEAIDRASGAAGFAATADVDAVLREVFRAGR